MPVQGYFVIKVAKEFQEKRFEEVLKDLESIPEVVGIEKLGSDCDLMVRILAPVRVILVADKIRIKKWLEKLYILHIEDIEIDEVKNFNVDDVLWLKRVYSSQLSTAKTTG